VHIISCSVDSASGNIETGLSKIYGHSLGPVSMASAGIILKRNVGSGATARAGIMNINGAAAGDVFCLTVYGV
jgi:hypothetical protein